MTELRQLFAYNAWANARTFAAAAAVPAAARGEGVTRGLFELLAHYAAVEENYFHLVRATLDATRAERRAWYESLGDDLGRLRERSAEVTRAYLRYLKRADAAEMGRGLRIPWLELDLRVREALLQVLVHSIEHRADVATIITRKGGEAPALDFVFWLKEEGSGTTPRA